MSGYPHPPTSRTGLHTHTLSLPLCIGQHTISITPSAPYKLNTPVHQCCRWSPLHEACNHGFTEITKLLINNGAHVNATGCDDDTSLHDAAVNSHFEVVRALVEVSCLTPSLLEIAA